MKYGKWSVHWLLFAACTGLLSGLLISQVKIDVLPILTISLVLMPIVLTRRLLAVVPIFLLFLSLGLQRGGDTMQRMMITQKLIGQKVEVVGKVTTDPVYHQSGQLEFRIKTVDYLQHRLPGQFRIRSFTPSVSVGDTVRLVGKLRDGFGPIQATMSYAETTVIQAASSPIIKVRSGLIASTNTVLHEPESTLGLGFLLGTRSIIPESLTTALSATGLTHIVAVSGYNLTILVSLTRRILARFSRAISVLAGVGLLSWFVVIAGSSPSIERAVVVSVLSLTAWYWGRSAQPLLLLFISAAITGYLEPLYVWGDIGWYLSFCAFFGVLVLAPLVSRRLYRKKQPGLIGYVVIETSMAQLATLPLIMLIFGDVSLISLLANVLILPLIPFAMLATFLAGLSGYFLPIVAGWIAWPTQILLSYIVNMIMLLSRLPGALQSVKLSPQGFVAIWLSILMLWVGLSRYKRVSVRSDYQLTDQTDIISADS